MVHGMTPGLLLPLLVLAGPPAKEPPAAPDATCEVDARALKPQFAPKLPRGFKLVSTKKDRHTLTQVLTTPDGFEVTLRYGGCEKLGFRFDVKGGTLTPKTVGAELVAVSKRLLPALPMAKDAFATPATLLRALDEATISMLPAQLPCGDATCQLALAAEAQPAPARPARRAKQPAAEQPPAGVLTLTYDFPL